MKVLFVAGFGPIVDDMATSRAFYGDALGLPLEGDAQYMSVPRGGLDGVKHFALWPLSGAAESCFGTKEWPADMPAPQGWLEIEVEDVEAATAELEAKGYRPLVRVKTEPWGQVVTRLLGPEGMLVGITYTPDMRGAG
jgi:catechol 2,3-dioxygenase-like lactoylglutathione lyase family enzyme